MFCSKCGKKIENDALFCEYCGSQVCHTVNETSVNFYASKKENKRKKKHFVAISVIFLILIGSVIVGILLKPIDIQNNKELQYSWKKATEYDQDGKVVSTINLSEEEDNVIVLSSDDNDKITRSEFDNKGRITKVSEYKSDTLQNETVYTYNEEGQRTELYFVWYDEDGTYYGNRTGYLYGEDEKVKEIIEYDEEGKVNKKIEIEWINDSEYTYTIEEYTYSLYLNRKGQIIKYIIENEEEGIVSGVIQEYDRKGRIIEKITFNSEKEEIKSRTIYEY